MIQHYWHQVKRCPTWLLSRNNGGTCRRCQVMLLSTVSVEDALLARVKEGNIRHDPSQFRAAKRLKRLQRVLRGYDNKPLVYRQKQALSSMGDPSVSPSPAPDDRESLAGFDIKIPRGLYLHGEVGTGKTMLMDAFFHNTMLDVVVDSQQRLRRNHFHSFMADIHYRIHQLKQQDLREKGRNFAVDVSRMNNPIIRVAQQLASESIVLCLDEFQVTDIADAMILSQLFEEMWACGTVVVATSNRAPDDLYEGGLNRDYFLPFIALLKRHCVIHEMKSIVDYRKLLVKAAMEQCRSTRHYFISSSLSTNGTHENYPTHFADALFVELLNGRPVQNVWLDVGLFGRKVLVDKADPDGLVARFDFSELCERNNMGAMDFRAIAEHFSILFIEHVPRLSLEDPSHHDRARRFITLIDEAYEAKCALFCSTDTTTVQSPEELLVVDDVDFDLLSDSKSASVRELAFAFRRAASRITEMCSEAWWDKALRTR